MPGEWEGRKRKNNAWEQFKHTSAKSCSSSRVPTGVSVDYYLEMLLWISCTGALQLRGILSNTHQKSISLRPEYRLKIFYFAAFFLNLIHSLVPTASENSLCELSRAPSSRGQTNISPSYALCVYRYISHCFNNGVQLR